MVFYINPCILQVAVTLNHCSFDQYYIVLYVLCGIHTIDAVNMISVERTNASASHCDLWNLNSFISTYQPRIWCRFKDYSMFKSPGIIELSAKYEVWPYLCFLISLSTRLPTCTPTSKIMLNMHTISLNICSIIRGFLVG